MGSTAFVLHQRILQRALCWLVVEWQTEQLLHRQASKIFFQLGNQIARWEGAAENLKAAGQMTWAGRMNNIQNRAIEITNHELISTQ